MFLNKPDYPLRVRKLAGECDLGFQKHGLEFFSLLVPAGCPLALLPLLVLIEFISYLARNISLGLRLAANIVSGCMFLNLLAGFTYNIVTDIRDSLAILFSSSTIELRYVCYSIGDTSEGSTNLPSTSVNESEYNSGDPTNLPSTSGNESEGNMNESDSEDDVDVAAKKLVSKHKSDVEELHKYYENKKLRISEKFIAEANQVGESDRDPLRQQRDESLSKLYKTYDKALSDIALQYPESESDYSSWTTQRGMSPGSDVKDGSEQSNTNEKQPSSSSVNPQSSGRSSPEGRFRQDSSDVMSDSAPMDFDDPS